MIDCGAPPTISDGTRTLTGTTFGETATYSCNSGLIISGSAIITCLASGSWEPEPACTMNRKLLSECVRLVHLLCSIHAVIDCGTPPSVSNASPGTPTNTMFNGMVTYTCDSTYEVSTGVTTATAACTITETWEPLPTCSRK